LLKRKKRNEVEVPSLPYPASSCSVCVRFVPPFLCPPGSALSITAYPFWSMRYHSMSLDFAFGRGLNGYYDNGLYYQNNFDAIIDSALVAAEKLGYKDVDIQGTPHTQLCSSLTVQHSTV